MMKQKIKQLNAFTLAEVLITLGVIGVVAAVTMPTLVTNIQERVRKEQVRTVKYKLTKATDKMNSLGKIGVYGSGDDATEEFVKELQKHMSIARVCKSNELEKCWPTENINAYPNGTTTLTPFAVNTLTTGIKLKALAIGTKNTRTVGLVTGDGVPMLMVYSPNCTGFDEAKTYTWSVEDGKPITNATTNCISAIFDINGSKGPNKIGQDVRTLNSLFGSTDLGVTEPVGVDICKKMKQKYGFQHCDGGRTTGDIDRWVGGMYACDQLGLHYPTMSTLANIANARYGITQIGAYTDYYGPSFGDCLQWIEDNNWKRGDDIICNGKVTTDTDSSLNNEHDNTSSIDGIYWSSLEIGTDGAYIRHIATTLSIWWAYDRSLNVRTLCVGD